MRFDEITLSTLRDKFGPVDGFTDIWCKIMRLKFLWQQYKNDGRIGPLLQSQCDELVSALEQISELPEPSKLFQAMLDLALEHATRLELAGNSPSSASVISTIQDDDAFTTPNMSPSPGVVKTLEWTPTTNVSRGPHNRQSNSGKTQRRKSDQGNFIERRARYEEFAIDYIKDVFRQENAKRIQAQQKQIAPADIVSLIRRGAALGISRGCIAKRYSEHCPDETPETIQWFNLNKPRARCSYEDHHAVTLNFLYEKAIEGLHPDAMAHENKNGKHQSTDVDAAEDEVHAEDAVDDADKDRRRADRGAENAEDPSKQANAAEADPSANKLAVPAAPAGAPDSPVDAPEEPAAEAADAEKAEADPSANKQAVLAAPADAPDSPADAPAELAAEMGPVGNVAVSALDAPGPTLAAGAEAVKNQADAEQAEADPCANKLASPADVPDSCSPADAPAELAARAGSFTASASAATTMTSSTVDSASAEDPPKAAADSKRTTFKAVAEADPSLPADVLDPSTAEREKPERAAKPPKGAAKRAKAEAAEPDPSSLADTAMKRPGRQPRTSSLRLQDKSKSPLQPTQTGSQTALLGKGTKHRSGSAPGIMCFDMAAASPGGKPAPATAATLREARTESGHKKQVESGPYSVSDDDQWISKRRKIDSESRPSLLPALACDGNSMPLNESATGNSPTSGLMQRANSSKACGDCSDRSVPDQSDAQRKADNCALLITGSILDSVGLASLVEREQVGSILHSLQERGLKLDLDSSVSDGDRCSSESLAGSGAAAPRLCQIRACI